MSGTSIRKRLTTNLLSDEAYVFETKEERTVPNRPLVQLFLVVLFFVVSFVLYIAVRPFNMAFGTPDGAVAKAVGIFLIFWVVVYYVVERFRKKMTFEKTFYVIFFLAFLIHLTYMLYTLGTTRQYDTWSTNNDSHYNYALSFYETGKLPDHHNTVDTVYQFYHPPLNAFIQGNFMHLFEILCPVASLADTPEKLFSACQILACLYSTLTSLFFMKTINLTNLTKEGKILAFAIVGLYPRLAEFSGQLNNDVLATALSAIALYYFCRWFFKERKWIDILLCGLFVGLAMMAKMSAAAICLGMGIVFAIVFFRSLFHKERTKVSRLIPQYIVFLLICAPLGLWFQFYTHFVWGLPFNFVFTNLNSQLFTGTRDWVLNNKPNDIAYYDENNSGLVYTSTAYNILVRYILPFYPPDINDLYCNAFGNYNLLFYSLRCSIFGEFSYFQGEGFALIAILSLYVAYWTMVVGTVRVMLAKKLKREGTLFLYLFLGMVAMLIYLKVKMPYGCSMDFRYIVPIILPCGYLYGRMTDYLGNENRIHCVGNKFFCQFVGGIFVTSSYLFYMTAI